MKPASRLFPALHLRLAALPLVALLSCTALPAYAQDETLEPQGTLPDWQYVDNIGALSADGQAAIGTAVNNSWQFVAYHFDKATGTLSEMTLGGGYSSAKAISANGLGVIGQSNDSGGQGHAFHWSLADGITKLTLGGSGGNALAISDNGLAVVGQSQNSAGQGQAFYWNKIDDITEISLGGTGGYADVISNDGTAVAGYSQNSAGEGHAFHWDTSNTTTQISLGGSGGRATGLSANGFDVVGYSQDTNGESHAFYWNKNDTTPTKLTLGGTSGEATAIARNGSAVIGKSENALGQTQAFHWRKGGTVQELSLGGTSGSAGFISDDGRMVAGESANAANQTQAFYWHEGGAVTALSLGGTQGKVTAMSRTGSSILGESEDSLGNLKTFLWTPSNDIKSLDQIIADAMIDMSNWTLTQGGEVLSANGLVVAGNGTYNGVAQPYFLTSTALVTPDDIARSLSALPVAQQQAGSAVSSGMQQSLTVARNAMQVYFGAMPASTGSTSENLQDISPAAGGSFWDTPLRKAAYVTGSFGLGHDNDSSNHAGTGTTGVLFQLSEHTAAGVGILGSYGRQETYLGGHSRATAAGVTLMAAHEAPSGLRLYASTAASKVDVSAKRQYMNGGAVDSSSSDTDGTAYGLAVKGGYEIPLRNALSLMPYAEVDVSHVRLDGYTERSGGLPASVASQSTTATVSRLGVEVGHDISPAMQIRGRAAWGHRYGDDGSLIATTTLGTQALSSDAGERNWGEGGISFNYKLNDATYLVTDVSGRAGRTGEPAFNAMAGFVWNWN